MAGGCSSLLPSSKETLASPWQCYRDAQLTFDKVVPGQTTLLELKHLQLDPEANPNIAILNYSDVMRRFLPHASISMADLDRGVRDCIVAKTLCKGFEVNQKTLNRIRDGNFVADVLGFNRETQISGWTFNGLILIKDGVVIYKLTGGQPAIEERQESSTPLGPIQSVGQKLFGF
jgi:hypothetical protein